MTAIATAGEHSLALLGNGEVMAWGNNGWGQLGNNTETNSSTPVHVDLSGATSISAGYLFSLAVMRNGHVEGWGTNGVGQLGQGSALPNAHSKVPIEVLNVSGATAVAGGYNSALALLANGHVKSWGANEHGQLGDGKTENESYPTEVSSLSEATAVAIGQEHGMALLANGHVKDWGEGGKGQLGDSSNGNSRVPVEVKSRGGLQVGIGAGAYHSLAFGTGL